jgi:peptidoglycan hydrolase-like protein with peptidoglycan-binding domain
MDWIKAKKLTRLIAILFFAAILAGCTVTPDTTGDEGNVPFPTFGTLTTEQSPSPSPTAETIIILPPGSSEIKISSTPGGWGSIIQSSQSFLTPTPTSWGGILSITATPGISSPTPTSSILKLGSTGPEVKRVQQRLKDLTYNVGSADGDFGKQTEDAVKAFQIRNNLQADGQVGAATMNRLFSSQALRPRATATPKPTAKPTPRMTATPKIAANIYLKSGSRGSEVRQMQRRLIELGYLAGEPTGVFDSATEAAVYAFQQRNTAYADGIAGQLTLTKLYSTSARRASTAQGIVGTSLQRGMMNNAMVRRAQQKLKDLGFYTGSVDGDFGISTEMAVKSFQAAHNLTVDGKIGENTYSRLFGNANPAVRTPTPNQSGTNPTRIPFYVSVTPNPHGAYVTLEEGQSGDLVRALQQALKNQGFYSGTVDGLFGFATTEAVKAFQRAKGLTVDGKAGQGTQRILYEGSFPSGS